MNYICLPEDGLSENELGVCYHVLDHVCPEIGIVVGRPKQEGDGRSGFKPRYQDNVQHLVQLLQATGNSGHVHLLDRRIAALSCRAI